MAYHGGGAAFAARNHAFHGSSEKQRGCDCSREAVCSSPAAARWHNAAYKPGYEGAKKLRGGAVLCTCIDCMPPPPVKVSFVASGIVLLAGRHMLLDRFARFDDEGPSSLLHVWVLLLVAIVIGHLARKLTRTPTMQWLVLLMFSAASPTIGECAHSRKATGAGNGAAATTAEVFSAAEPPPAPCGADTCARAGLTTGQAGGAEGVAEQDCVTLEKQRAQAEAAARQLALQQGMATLLARLTAHSSLADAAQALYGIARMTMAAPEAVQVLVQQGGLALVLNMLAEASEQLRLSAGRQRIDADGEDAGAPAALQAAQVVPAVLLQGSWVLLQVAHGPPACAAALAASGAPVAAHALLCSLTEGAVQRSIGAEATQALARNAGWVLFKLLAAPGSSAAAAQVLLPGGGAAAAAIAPLVQLLALCCGQDAALFAGGALALLAHTWSGETATAADSAPAGDGAATQAVGTPAAADAALLAAASPAALGGICLLLQRHARAAPLDRAAAAALAWLAQRLVVTHCTALLRTLIAEHLLGSFVAALPRRAASLLVCQVLSSAGQALLAELEGMYEVSVALAVAQLASLPVHIQLEDAGAGVASEGGPGTPPGVQLPPPPQQLQQHAAQAGHGEGRGAAAATGQEETFTDVLTCRLLLQGGRLAELVAACLEEVTAQAGADVAMAGVEQPSEVVVAVLDLNACLLARNLEAAAAQQLPGPGLERSSSDASITSADASSEGGSDRAPLPWFPRSNSQDVFAHACPFEGDADAADPLGSDAGGGGGGDGVVLTFGDGYQHLMQARTLRRLRRCSRLLRSVLDHADIGDGPAADLFLLPRFSPAQNCWAVRCLALWADVGALPLDLSAPQAAQLWVAADFLQVDAMQAACEELLAQRFGLLGAPIALGGAQAAAALELTLELCSCHPLSSGRLQRAAVRAVLRAAAAFDAAAAASLLRTVCGCGASRRSMVQVGLAEELRDRLATLVTLNAGLY